MTLVHRTAPDQSESMIPEGITRSHSIATPSKIGSPDTRDGKTLNYLHLLECSRKNLQNESNLLEGCRVNSRSGEMKSILWTTQVHGIDKKHICNLQSETHTSSDTTLNHSETNQRYTWITQKQSEPDSEVCSEPLRKQKVGSHHDIARGLSALAFASYWHCTGSAISHTEISEQIHTPWQISPQKPDIHAHYTIQSICKMAWRHRSKSLSLCSMNIERPLSYDGFNSQTFKK